MSEREPITAELRRVMSHTTMAGIPLVEIGEYEFGHRCDAIDAVHAGLERENAELRQRVAVLDKRGDSMHDGGSITDELRGWYKDRMFMGNGWQELDNIADRIDAEHEGTIKSVMNDALYYANDKDMAEHGWVRLPLDADGEYIHAGDVLDGYGKSIEVVELRHGRSGWVLISRDGNGYADTFAFTHHHGPTVEDVLREFAQEMNENLGMYTGEAIDADEWRKADERTIAEYAAKLRLAEGVDE